MEQYIGLRDVISAYESGSSEGRVRITDKKALPWTEVISYDDNKLIEGKYGDIHIGRSRHIPDLKCALKIIPEEKKVVSGKANTDYSSWREIKHLMICTEISKKRISPNLPLMIRFGRSIKCSFKSKTNACLYHFSGHTQYTLVEYIKERKPKEDELNTIIFQVQAALFTIHKVAKMSHGNLDWNNILIHYPMPKMQSIIYQIEGLKYLVPIRCLVILSEFGKSKLHTKSKENTYTKRNYEMKKIMNNDYLQFLKFEQYWKMYKLPQSPPLKIVNYCKKYKIISENKENTLENYFINYFMPKFGDIRIGKSTKGVSPFLMRIDNSMIGELVVFKKKHALCIGINADQVELIIDLKKMDRVITNYKNLRLFQGTSISDGQEKYLISNKDIKLKNMISLDPSNYTRIEYQ